MLKLALKKLFVALGYTSQEVEEGYSGNEMQKLEGAISGKWYYSLLLIMLSPVASSFISKGKAWIDNYIMPKKPDDQAVK